MKLAPAVGVMLAVILALVLAKECGYRAGQADAKAVARDARDDSTVSRLVHEAAVSEQRFRRERDSTGREIRRLQQRIAGGRPATPKPPTSSGADSATTSLPADEAASAPLLLRDSLTASLLSGRQQDSLQLLFWAAQVAARDSLIPALQRSRDSWRREASRPRYTISDIGGGAIAGWGLAEKSPQVVAVGAGVVLLPRLLGAVKRLL